MKVSIRTRVGLLRQRIILTIRFYFRLPIDDARDYQRQSLDQQFAETLRAVTAILNQMNTRLHWYETRVPLLRKEYKAFCVHQKKLMKAEEARQAEFNALVEGGVPEIVARERIWPRKTEPVEPRDDQVVGEIEPTESSG